MPAQTPYPISGTVTIQRPGGASATNVQGARMWLKDRTEGTIKTAITSEEGTLVTTTNVSGQYIFDLANFTSSYAHDDKVRIYLQVEDILTWLDHTVDTGIGFAEVNFALKRRSGMKDGLAGTIAVDRRRYGLHHLGTGMRPGLKDGLT